MHGIVDTSVLIAEEQGRPLATERLPQQTAISTVTLAELVASAFAGIATATGRPRRYADVQDMWIAATAKAHGAMLFTQDGDFERFVGVEVVRV